MSLLGCATPVLAQSSVPPALSMMTPSPAFSTWPVVSSDPLGALNTELRRATQPTHWVRGGLIGAGVGAAGALLIGAVACSMDESDGCNYAAGAVVGAGLGFLVGALIGGQFPKHEQPSAEAEAKRCLTSASC